MSVSGCFRKGSSTTIFWCFEAVKYLGVDGRELEDTGGRRADRSSLKSESDEEKWIVMVHTNVSNSSKRTHHLQNAGANENNISLLKRKTSFTHIPPKKACNIHIPKHTQATNIQNLDFKTNLQQLHSSHTDKNNKTLYQQDTYPPFNHLTTLPYFRPLNCGVSPRYGSNAFEIIRPWNL